MEFQTSWLAEEFPLTACACSFCRQHGARTCRDPAGTLRIEGDPNRYQFGLKTAEFWLCPRCGVYVAAVLEHNGQRFATLNVNLLDLAPQLTQEARLGHYDQESAEQRIQRRAASWTPLQASRDS